MENLNIKTFGYRSRLNNETRKCSHCEYIGDNFSYNSYYCRPCNAKWQREHQRKLPVKIRQQNWRKYNLHKYNLTPEEHDILYNKQNGKCAICGFNPENGNQNSNRNALCVDHNHKTGKIRGLLCQYCNRSMGLVKDNKETILKMYNYLMVNDG